MYLSYYSTGIYGNSNITYDIGFCFWSRLLVDYKRHPFVRYWKKVPFFHFMFFNGKYVVHTYIVQYVQCTHNHNKKKKEKRKKKVDLSNPRIIS